MTKTKELVALEAEAIEAQMNAARAVIAGSRKRREEWEAANADADEAARFYASKAATWGEVRRLESEVLTLRAEHARLNVVSWGLAVQDLKAEIETMEARITKRNGGTP
jgi:hypothetical protein